MKFNRKGQGSIEYLMILAAVLAIAVVVVVLATTFFTRYREPAELAQDKSVCAASGIQLLNYIERYEDSSTAATGLNVSYAGKELNCEENTSDNPSGESVCKIGTTTNNECLRVYADRDGCTISTVVVGC
ncbi:class III signal peptide-containing protein [archaeon]|nr:class III signal peptide-containing protein [archaeon]